MRSGTTSKIGERARAARERLGLNQSEVAERVEISPEVYGRFERGLVTPRIRTLLALCDVLQVQPNDLLVEDRGPRSVDDKLSVELRELVTVLHGAERSTVKRVTQIARWLRSPVEPPLKGARARKHRKR